MKAPLFFLTSLFYLLVFSSVANSADIYAEYQMTGTTSAPIISKMYGKNGNLRTETSINMGGRQMTTTTLMLKNNINVAYVFNSLTTTYTETAALARRRRPCRTHQRAR